jgi:hypothetical protein
MGLGGGYGGQEVLHKAENMPPTFNFITSNQKPEENKALKRSLISCSRALPFQECTYCNDSSRNSQILQCWPKLERLGTDISEQARSVQVHGGKLGIPRRSSKQQ